MLMAENLMMMRRRRRANAGGGAGALLGSELQGLAFVADDMTLAIRDTTTPANTFLGDINARFTYASPSTKWILNRSGLYESGTTLRCEFNAAGDPLGLRIEEARTNVFTFNGDLTNAIWAPANLSVTPEGTAFRVAPTSSGSARRFQRGSTGAASGVYTWSVFAKAAGIRFLYVFQSNGAGVAAWFDLQTGAVSNVAAGYTASTRLDADGFYRCILTTPNLTPVFLAYIGLSSAAGSENVTANGTDGVLLRWPQLELGAVATSPIVTEGSTVTRAQDVIFLASSLAPSLSSAVTLYARFRATVGVIAANHVVVGIGETLNDRFQITSGGAASVLNANVITASSSFSGTIGLEHKVAAALAPNDFGSTLNAAAVQIDTSVGVPAGAIRFGHIRTPAIAVMNGHLREVLVLPRRMSNAELQAVTA